MFRVYCYLAGYRYYWSKARIWTMWSRAARPLKKGEAEKLAQSEQAYFERI